MNYASVIGLQQIHSKEHEVHLTTICSDGLWSLISWNTQYPLYPLLVLGECSVYEHMSSEQLDCTSQLVFTLCYFTRDETLQCVLLFFSTALVYFSKHIWRSQKLKKCISWNSSCMQKNTIVNLHNAKTHRKYFIRVSLTLSANNTRLIFFPRISDNYSMSQWIYSHADFRGAVFYILLCKAKERLYICIARKETLTDNTAQYNKLNKTENLL